MDEIVSQESTPPRVIPAEKLRLTLHQNYGLSQVPKDVAADIIGKQCFYLYSVEVTNVISDHVLENDFSSGEKGLMTQNWNPLTAKMLYNYDLGTFEELTKRLSFPVLHITSRMFNRSGLIEA